MLPSYKVITRLSVMDIPYENGTQYERDCINLVEEQDAILKEYGFVFDKKYKIHMFDSHYNNETYIKEEINEAVQYLAIKDGVDLVKFENGSYGFVAYYNGHENGFEILESEDD